MNKAEYDDKGGYRQARGNSGDFQPSKGKGLEAQASGNWKQPQAQ
jgi:hypothetical protein